MTTWVCIGWEDVPSESKPEKLIPTPVEKRVALGDDFDSARVLAAFKRKFPGLRNHTAHRKDEAIVVRHRGPGDYPIVQTKSEWDEYQSKSIS